MVYVQVQPLLALALEGLEKAKTLFLRRLGMHLATLGLAIISAVALSYSGTGHGGFLGVIELGAAGLAVVTEVAALYFHHCGLELHSLGRQAIRRVMLLDALNPDEALRVTPEFRGHFGAKVQQSARELESKDQSLSDKDKRLFNYYYSDKPLGQARLRDHLYESAIFSQHLYAAAWKFSLVCVLVLLVAALVVLFYVIGGSTDFVLRVVIVLVAFIPLCQELDHLLLYRLVARQLARLVERVEGLYSTPLAADQPDPRLLAELGDYNAATTFAPPIRTLVYKMLVSRLRTDFEERMRKLGQTRA